MWDDDDVIYQNPELGGFGPGRLTWILTDVDLTGHYSPLLALFWTSVCTAFGKDPAVFHAINLLIHGCNAVLLYYLLGRLVAADPVGGSTRSPRRWTSCCIAGAALFWSLHPLRAELVAWAAVGSYSLACLLLLSSLIFYLRSARGGEGARRNYLSSVALFLGSILTHPIGLAGCFLFLLLDIYPLRRVGGLGRWWTPEVRRFLWAKLPFVLGGVAIAATSEVIRRLPINQAQPQDPGLAEFGILPRLMQSLYFWSYSLCRPWYPTQLSPTYYFLYDFDPLGPIMLGSAVLLLLVTIAAWWSRKRQPWVAALWAFHLIILFPIIGFNQHPHVTNDRYLIFSSMAWSVCIVLAGLKTPVAARRGIYALGLSTLIVLGILTIRQVGTWHDTQHLFEHTLDVVGRENYHAADIQARLGHWYLQQGDTGQAEERLRTALAVNAELYSARYELANCLIVKRDLADAEHHLRQLVSGRSEPGATTDVTGRAVFTDGTTEGCRRNVPECATDGSRT